jgi:hypothetical protein
MRHSAAQSQAEPNFAARNETNLEGLRCDPVVIGPGSHLGHDATQVGAIPPNFDNVHPRLPNVQSSLTDHG